MKIKVKRKVANGLVIGLQLAAIAPMVASSAIGGIEAAATLDAFVANPPPAALTGSEASLQLASAADKPVNDNTESDDPTHGDSSAIDLSPKTHDPSGTFDPSGGLGAVGLNPPTPGDDISTSREDFTEPPDGE